MDLIDVVRQLAARIPQQLPVLRTEEATKNALVMPIINALGYNVFDPLEVIPEFTADVGTKKGEKVDYAIVIDGKPMILIECKTVGSTLSINHASQLYRYFSVTEARFAILTNGINFWFYTDIDAPNRMDEKPFFEFSMHDVTERSVDELKKFARSTFNLDNILSNASELKYMKQLKKTFAEELESPSEEFVRLLTARVYSGTFRSHVKEQFTGLVKRASREFIRDEVNARLKNALEGNGGGQPLVYEEPRAAAEQPADDEAESEGVVTTPEEMEAFHIVRAILAQDFDPERIVMRDTKSYCGILLDNNNRKPICRLRFNYSQKYLTLVDETREEKRIAIGNVREIYKHTAAIMAAAHLYDGKRTPKESGEANQSPTPASEGAAEGQP